MGIDNFLKGVSPFPLFDYEAIFWALAKNKNPDRISLVGIERLEFDILT